jgi:hypothetical protein
MLYSSTFEHNKSFLLVSQLRVYNAPPPPPSLRCTKSVLRNTQSPLEFTGVHITSSPHPQDGPDGSC